jgi:hypothetical protein
MYSEKVLFLLLISLRMEAQDWLAQPSVGGSLSLLLDWDVGTIQEFHRQLARPSLRCLDKTSPCWCTDYLAVSCDHG